MAKQEISEELGQLAGLLFNRASNRWYWAISLEALAGVLGVIITAVVPVRNKGMISLVITGLVLISGYTLHVFAEVEYERAESMRRHSVLIGGLGYPVESWRVDQWRQAVGERIRKTVKQTPRAGDYYETTEPKGPLRLAEMTTESAFYTYHLYCHIHRWLLRFLIALGIAILLGLFLPPLLSHQADLFLERLLYTIIPVVVGADILGWWFRLGRTIAGITEVQRDIEEAIRTGNPSESRVIRLVADYDNHVATGIPIHNFIYEHYKADIAELWKAHGVSTQEVLLVTRMSNHLVLTFIVSGACKGDFRQLCDSRGLPTIIELRETGIPWSGAEVIGISLAVYGGVKSVSELTNILLDILEHIRKRHPEVENDHEKAHIQIESADNLRVRIDNIPLERAKEIISDTIDALRSQTPPGNEDNQSSDT